MIISRGRRYIFVHAPKTGGTAMTLALEGRAMKDDILIADTPKARQRRHRLEGAAAAGRLWKHARLADIAGLVTEAEIAGFFVFTLVRNPWDRMVSYYHWLRVQDFDHPSVSLAKRTDFCAFVCDPATVAAFAAAPYTSYVTTATGAERCDLFLPVERLEAEIAPLAAHLGFSPLPLPRANGSIRDRDWRGYYSDSAAECVARFAAADIDRFGYRFDDGGNGAGCF